MRPAAVVALELQQSQFELKTAGGRIAAERVSCNDPVAGDDQWYSVFGHHIADGSRGPWRTGKLCQFRISLRFTSWNEPALFDDPSSEIGIIG